MKVLVFIEQRDAQMKHSAFELLNAASKIAPSANDVAAVIVGSGVGSLAEQLNGYGVNKVFVADAPELTDYNNSTYVSAVETAISNFQPGLVLGAASPMGKDIFPRLAARLDSAIATDVTSVEASGDDIVVKKPVFAGKAIANLELKGATKLVTVRLNTFADDKSGEGSVEVEAITVEASNSPLKTIEVKGSSDKADLTEATRIVSGGRAMGSEENFKILDECAEVLNATVGASRAAVDSGYAPHHLHIGQTGKTVNPNLFISLVV